MLIKLLKLIKLSELSFNGHQFNILKRPSFNLPFMPPQAAQPVPTKTRKNRKMKFQWISFSYSSQTRHSLT